MLVHIATVAAALRAAPTALSDRRAVLRHTAALAGAALPSATIDGHDVSDLLMGGPGMASPTQHFLYYTSDGALAGIRRGPWKLLLAKGELFHLEHDVSERDEAAADQQQPLATAESNDVTAPGPALYQWGALPSN